MMLISLAAGVEEKGNGSREIKIGSDKPAPGSEWGLGGGAEELEQSRMICAKSVSFFGGDGLQCPSSNRKISLIGSVC